MRHLILALAFLLMATSGCGSASKDESPRVDDRSQSMMPQAAQVKQDKDKAKENPDKKPEARDETPRKIIYTANLDVVVDDFEKATEHLKSLLRENGAYIEASDLRGQHGQPRSGLWTLRVPQAQFEEFVAAIAKLGEAIHNRTDSQDVSGSYYDTRERLKTLEVEEYGLRKYYESNAPTAKPEDMMAVRRELKEIRAQIEEMKGRLKRWASQVDLATVVVKLQDRKDYVPPVVPNFGGTVGRAFSGSIDALVSLGRGIVLAVVAAAPWLAIVAVLGIPWWPRLWRWVRAPKRVPAAEPPPPAGPAPLGNPTASS